MNNKKEGTFAILCSLFVLFSAMINPLVSVSISVIVLAGYGVYKLFKNK